MSLLVRLLLLVLALLAAQPRARAEPPRDLRARPSIELPLLGLGAALWLATDLAKPAIAPRRCRWCDDNALDRGVRDALHWSRPEPAARLSDALLFGLVPGAAFGSVVGLAARQLGRADALVDAMVIGEALVLASALTQVAKFSVARERPYVQLQREESRDFVAGPDDHLSFFSGHTSSTFALAVAAGSTASFRGYRRSEVVWAVGVPLAVLTGYLRIAADRHYLSDVLTGALVGSLVGVLVPWLHARDTGVYASAGAPAMLTMGFRR